MNAYKENEWVVISLPPKFESHHSLQFSVLCKEYIQKGNVRFIVDASRLTFIDSYGIGVLLKSAVQLRDFNGEIRIRELSGDPLNLFRQTQLVNIFKIENNRHVSHSEKSLFGINPSHSDLNLDLEEKGDVVVFHLSGVMKFPRGIKKFEEEALAVMAEKNKFLLDMEKLEYLDSNFVDKIIKISCLLRTSGGEVCICRANELVKDILEMANVGRIISIYESLALAIERLEGVIGNAKVQ